MAVSKSASFILKPGENIPPSPGKTRILAGLMSRWALQMLALGFDMVRQQATYNPVLWSRGPPPRFCIVLMAFVRPIRPLQKCMRCSGVVGRTSWLNKCSRLPPLACSRMMMHRLFCSNEPRYCTICSQESIETNALNSRVHDLRKTSLRYSLKTTTPYTK
jgi:hypothetical protein